MRLEVLVNQVCNVDCAWCNRGIDVARFKDMTMTADEMRRGVEQIKRQNLVVTRCTLSGGEPLLNPHLQGIIREADKLPGLRHGRVLTNGQISSEQRNKVELPNKWHWVVAPIVDPSNPSSGKSEHVPFFVSPKDHGMDSQWENCTVRKHCGLGFDRHGFSMCGVASTLGRFLKIDPYTDEVPTGETPKGICEHCPYGMGARGNSRKTNREIQWSLIGRAYRGEIPAISETFEQGIASHRKAPMVFQLHADP